MLTFILLAALLAAGALAVLLAPYWLPRRQSSPPAPSARHSAVNIAILRDQINELERDRAAGVLAEDDFTALHTEAARRLLEAGAEEGAAVAGEGAQGKARLTPWVLLFLLPLAAAGLYALLGAPQALNPQSRNQVSGAQIEAMVDKLAARLEASPNDPQGWIMLARSYKVLGKLDLAVKAFARAGDAVNRDAQVLASYADALVALHGGDFSGQPNELIARALRLEPTNGMALWLAGSSDFARGDFDGAIRRWQKLLALMPADTEGAQELRASIDEAVKRGGKLPKQR